MCTRRSCCSHWARSRSANLLFGLGLALLAVVFEWRLRDTPVTHIAGALVGGAIGLALAKGIGAALSWADPGYERVAFLHSFVLLVWSYLGLMMGGRKGEWLEPVRLMEPVRRTGPERRYKILDTCVVIDGRIADIPKPGYRWNPGHPAVRAEELQHVADSADSMKRNRGRRGLDILQKIQKMAGVEVIVWDADFPRCVKST